MKPKPIIFSTPMVQSILKRRKTQTRRIIKSHQEEIGIIEEKPKYQEGDIIWVREKWKKPSLDCWPEREYIYRADYPSALVSDIMKWKSSIFMPKKACRIFLKVTNVRKERFREITTKDAISEGVEPIYDWDLFVGYRNYLTGKLIQSPILSFYTLWISIYGPHSYDYNPWVWVYTFKLVEKPENF